MLASRIGLFPSIYMYTLMQAQKTTRLLDSLDDGTCASATNRVYFISTIRPTDEAEFGRHLFVAALLAIIISHTLTGYTVSVND